MKSLLLHSPVASLQQWPKRCLLLLGFVQLSFFSIAQWSTSSTTNNLIALAATSDYKNGQQVISDGAGGAIIVWYDDRNGLFNADIFAQRINASGVVQWTANGVAICTTSNDQYLPNVVSDGAGGAIISWQDFRSGVATNPDIYAQRINAAGVVQWTANGVAICNAANEQFSPAMVADGSGGAIFAWQDARTPGNQDIYAQRIDASGTVQWTSNGVVISAASNSQGSPSIAPDGAGGGIISWQDYRSGSSDVYAQRINSSGAVQWTADGVPVSSAMGDQYFASIVSDGSNGAIITWEDFRSGISDIYAQRINGAGVAQWTPDGVVVCAASSYQYSPVIASDGSNGAIITWYDVRNGNQDIFAQRINNAGSVQWPGNGVAISTTPEIQTVPTIIADGTSGAIITWQDQRNGAANGDVFAQRVNASGAIQWTSNGIAVGNSTARDEYKPKLVSDGAGGAIIAWNAYDIPNYAKADIYAQKVNANGTLGGGGDPNPCPTLLTLVSTADDYSSGSVTKQAAASNGKIEATNLITSSANVTYEAKSIELKPGFRADNGTVFKAQVGGCGGQ